MKKRAAVKRIKRHQENGLRRVAQWAVENKTKADPRAYRDAAMQAAFMFGKEGLPHFRRLYIQAAQKKGIQPWGQSPTEGNGTVAKAEP